MNSPLIKTETTGFPAKEICIEKLGRGKVSGKKGVGILKHPAKEGEGNRRTEELIATYRCPKDHTAGNYLVQGPKT